ncbi:lasso peptide biosynthesis PqqD family chaperone [Paenisporosarcina antarctica]|uniref:Lasso peptide biosynthesis PqqD family chaperone n=1 Tax=Paenisporosarcina antarctica TaxID=417367 RepID=A0A4P7A090_9BACL|nr:lasso peptide biosynthesis PqqD family chaperone [Paenisporosarcina antarctica]QBP41994.1 lasso peptide biosynthesis PqqD family chaperone [Paenisporosarcina antarctica]
MNKNVESTTNHVYSQSPGNIVSDMDGDKVMLSVHNGKYYNLGELGGAIWDLIKEPLTFQQLVETLRSQYEVDQTECEEQVTDFLSKLKKDGLITIEDKVDA